MNKINVNGKLAAMTVLFSFACGSLVSCSGAAKSDGIATYAVANEITADNEATSEVTDTAGEISVSETDGTMVSDTASPDADYASTTFDMAKIVAGDKDEAVPAATFSLTGNMYAISDTYGYGVAFSEVDAGAGTAYYVILNTTDSGRTWSYSKIGYPVYGGTLEYIGFDENGNAAAYFGPGTGGWSEALISTDKGISWENYEDGVFEPVESNLGSTDELYNISMPDSTVALSDDSTNSEFYDKNNEDAEAPASTDIKLKNADEKDIKTIAKTNAGSGTVKDDAQMANEISDISFKNDSVNLKISENKMSIAQNQIYTDKSSGNEILCYCTDAGMSHAAYDILMSADKGTTWSYVLTDYPVEMSDFDAMGSDGNGNIVIRFIDENNDTDTTKYNYFISYDSGATWSYFKDALQINLADVTKQSDSTDDSDFTDISLPAAELSVPISNVFSGDTDDDGNNELVLFYETTDSLARSVYYMITVDNFDGSLSYNIKQSNLPADSQISALSIDESENYCIYYSDEPGFVAVKPSYIGSTWSLSK